MQIRFSCANKTAIAHGTPHDLAKYIAAAVVRWNHAVMNQKCRRARMVGVDPKRDIGSLIGVVFHPEQMRRAADDWLQQIRVVVRKMALQNRGDTFETHAGVYGWSRQWSQRSIYRAIELHKDEIPDLDISSATI